MSDEKTIKISKIEVIALLFFLGIVLGFYLKTTLSTPIVFGDEGYHVRMSQWIAENKEYPTWVPFSGTNLEKFNFARPPLFNILQASFLFIFGFHEIIVKVLTPFIAVLTGLVVYLLAKKLYGRGTGIISAIMLVMLPSFVTYSVLFYTDILFVFYTTLFILLFLLAIKDDSKKYWLLSAVFAGLAFLTKHPAIIFFVFIPLVAVYQMIFEKNKTKINILRNYFMFGIIFLLIISPFILRNFYYYQSPLCYPLPLIDDEGCSIHDFEAKYKFETRTAQGGTETSLFGFGLTNYVNFAYGGWSDNAGILQFIYKPINSFSNSILSTTGLTLSSLLIIIGFFGGLIILVTKRSHVNFILLLMLLMSLAIFYQASDRAEDTARHTLMWAPLMAIISSIYWTKAYNFLSKIYKYLGVVVILAVLILGYQSLSSKIMVMGQVKQFSPSFFEACDWVKENLSDDSLLMTFWGHRAVYNCQRSISPAFADIRLSDNPEYISYVAQQHGITHFFIQKFSISDQPTRESYSIAFLQLLENNPDKFEKIYENGPTLEQCLQQGSCDGNIIYKVIGVAA